MKRHALIEVQRLYEGGAIIRRERKAEKRIGERYARTLDAALRDELKFRSCVCGDGRIYWPLTAKQQRAKVASHKRAATIRERRALGLTIYHGWAQSGQRR